MDTTPDATDIHDLARAMNGDLTVTSTMGVGSRFTLRLPRSSGR